MSGSLRMVSLVALVLGAFALIACGGADEREERNTYVRQLNAAEQEFADSATVVARRASPATIGEYRRSLERFESTITDFATKLRGIKVPRAVHDEHARLVAAVTRFGTDLKELTGDALDNLSARSVDDARRAIETAAQQANVRIDEAAAAINSKLGGT